MNAKTAMFKALNYTPPRPPVQPETQVDRCTKCEHGLVDKDLAYCISQDLAFEIEGDEVIMGNGGFSIECYGEEWRHKNE